jgi:uncharacterized protein YoxC
MQDNFYIIPHIAVFILAIGFIAFILLVSPEIRKLVKRNKKIARRRKRIKENSKARDFQI